MPEQVLAEPDFGAAFGEPDAAKRIRLLSQLKALTAQHAAHCPAYANMLAGLHPSWREADSLETLPWVPVGAFKHLRLLSVAEDEVIRELRSSGTTGSQPSRVYLDRATAARQTRALATIIADFLGRERRPMLIIDQPQLLQSGAALGARGAAVLGFATFGRQHRYALDADMQLDLSVLREFIANAGGQAVLVFGFTALIWQQLLNALQTAGEHCQFPPGSVLLHGGGWKKLAALQVDNAAFKQRVKALLGIEAVHNYYGMAEQVGSIFMECAAGRLHVPAYAEVIVRDGLSLAPLPQGQRGVIQVLSELPTSYPGHSLLTEDLGLLLGTDDCPCGRRGRSFQVETRLPRAELRGCSDTQAI